MKIKVRKSNYTKVMALKPYKRRLPIKVVPIFRFILKTLSQPDLKKTHFTYKSYGLDRIKKDEPILVLMNHSSFIDLKIALSVLYPRPINIVCEMDGFIGKDWLMRHIGCIPTHKFNTDPALVKDLLYCTRELKTSILMYPEASYSFDGTTPTPLSESLGKCIKLLKVPVVMIKTYGAFQRDPLYNKLQLRDVDVSADISLLFTKEDALELSLGDINAKLREAFSFDHFKWQKENGVVIDEAFRAEGLESVLYKCPHCLKEETIESQGTTIKCDSCNSQWRLNEDGSLSSSNGENTFSHIPTWVKWEREETIKEVKSGTYKLETPVKIYMQVNTSALYSVGEGRLSQTSSGFHLISNDGLIDFSTSALDNYSLSSDLFWYEMGDMISIGDERKVFYLFPPKGKVSVLKARFATEEFYKEALSKLRNKSENPPL